MGHNGTAVAGEPLAAARYLTLATLATYVSLSESTLRRLLKGDDPIPSLLIGRCRRFDMLAVDRWLARQAGVEGAVDRILAEARAARSLDSALDSP